MLKFITLYDSPYCGVKVVCSNSFG